MNRSAGEIIDKGGKLLTVKPRFYDGLKRLWRGIGWILDTILTQMRYSLTAKIRTRNLLDLRLRWFESSPAQTLYHSRFSATRADL